jgi:pyruvate,water dikinase
MIRFMLVSKLLKSWGCRVFAPSRLVRHKYRVFKQLLQFDRNALEYIARLEEIYYQDKPVDFACILRLCRNLHHEVDSLARGLTDMDPLRYKDVPAYERKIDFYIQMVLLLDEIRAEPPYVQALEGDEAEIGGKARTLVKIQHELGIQVPRGFVLNSSAFTCFLEHNHLQKSLDDLLAATGSGKEKEFGQICAEMQKLVLDSEVPQAVFGEVARYLRKLHLQECTLALRSSAVAEDSAASFAGQYESMLRVDARGWPAAYKSVIASKYSPRAVRYRIEQGLSDSMAPMAVLIQEMIEPLCSGIMYTRGIRNKRELEIYLLEGSGESLAAGKDLAEEIFLPREQEESEVEKQSASLCGRDLKELKRLGLALERHFQAPQDVEWCREKEKGFYILQSRDLRIGDPKEEIQESRGTADDGLAEGSLASQGRAVGRLVLREDLEEGRVDGPCILYVPGLDPELTVYLDRVEGIVSEKGSTACHLASVAREKQVPVLFGLKGKENLEIGREISMDADQGRIWTGRVFEPEEMEHTDSSWSGSPVKEILGRAMVPISRLHLTDPETEEFTPQGCRSMHDLVRFAHEAAVRGMFDLVGKRGLSRSGAKRLVSDTPLVLYVLDVDGGIASDAEKAGEVEPEQIVCRPMRKLWDGFRHPAVRWEKNIPLFDWNEFERVEHSFVNPEKSILFSSYAVLGPDYLHALLRFGYHFAVVDSLLGESMEHNYIHFRFKGGGAGFEQQYLRLQLVSAVLEQKGFQVRTTGDLVTAALDRRDSAQTARGLTVLGVVLGKTVRMDMRLYDRQQMQKQAQEIVEEIRQ